MPNPLPTRGALDLGPTLTNVRAPIANELSAVHVENMKDWIIDLATEIGNPDGSTSGSLWEGIAGGGGFSYVAVTADATLPSANAIVDVDTTGLTAPDTLELTLPAAAAGLVFFVRKTAGAANETITLVRAAGEQIDGVAASRLLPGSDNYIDATAHSTPNAVWMVYCDGTNWRTHQAAPETRAVWGKSGPPVDSVDTVAGYDYTPGSTWHAGGTPGYLWIQTGVDAGDAKWRRIDAPGLLLELDTTSTAQIETTTEVQGKTGPSGSAFAGTVTPTANVASLWDSATKVITLTTSGSMEGFGLRRVFPTANLPGAGFIVDLGIADLGAFLTTRLVLALYEQRAGTNGRGIALSFLYNDPALYVTGFGDDGIDSPAVNTSPLAFDAVTGGWANALVDFGKGPARVIAEFRKVDGSSPERWTLRVRLEGHAGAVQSHCYSGISAPASAWSTALDVAGATLDRIAIGAWCTSAEGGDLAISHLRVYELGSAIPT